MRRRLLGAVVLVAVLAACGGGDDDDAGGRTPDAVEDILGGDSDSGGGDGGGRGEGDDSGDDGDEADQGDDAITTVDALAAALVAAGIPCDGLTPEPLEVDESSGPESRSGAATCTSDSGALTLEVFEDAAHLEQYQRQVATVGCALLKELGITEVHYAHGDHWSIRPEDTLDQDTAERVAEALGGEAEHLTCD